MTSLFWGPAVTGQSLLTATPVALGDTLESLFTSLSLREGWETPAPAHLIPAIATLPTATAITSTSPAILTGTITTTSVTIMTTETSGTPVRGSTATSRLSPPLLPA